MNMKSKDQVNPDHYTWHPLGYESADITEHLPGMMALAVKYLWRLRKTGDPLMDLRKAKWCLERERKRVDSMTKNPLYTQHPLRYKITDIAHYLDSDIQVAFSHIMESYHYMTYEYPKGENRLHAIQTLSLSINEISNAIKKEERNEHV